MPIVLICEWCKKPFKTYLSRKGRKKYCSKECYQAARASGRYKLARINRPIGSKKRCIVCGQEEDISEFYPNKNLLDGLRNECKRCCQRSASEWQKQNQEKARKRKTRWYDDNPGKTKEATYRRRSKKQSLPSDFSAEDWEYVKELFDFRCAYCRKKKPLQQEHLIPLSRKDIHNPGTVWENIVPACKECNSLKYTKTHYEFCTPAQIGYIEKTFERK